MRMLSGFAATTLALLLLVGCSDPEPRPDKSLEIMWPQNGASIEFGEDTDRESEGLNYNVLVFGENLEEGDVVVLTAGESTAERTVGSESVLQFNDFNLGNEAGEVTLVASLAGSDVASESISVTLGGFCPTLQITSPASGTRLQAEDDEDSGEPGFQYSFIASTSAENGAMAVLYEDGSRTSNEAEVNDTVIRFNGVTLSEGEHDYEIRIEETADSCSWDSVDLTIDTGAPDCQITDPEAAVETLNQALDLDPDTAGAQVDFLVSTDSDGEITVEFYVDGAPRDTATAASGTALFEEVSLDEGERTIRAVCTDAAGNSSVSADRSFLVDTIAPSVDILSPECETIFPLGHDDLDALEGQQVEFQVRSRSSDVAGIEIRVAGASALPDPYGSTDASEGTLYVDVEVGTWSIEVVVTDDAENESIETCQITLDGEAPQVVIADPVVDAMPAIADDLDPSTPDRLEYDVIACASEASSPTVTPQLYSNGSLVSIESVTVEEASCVAGDITLPYMITFISASIGQDDQCLTVDYTDIAGTTAGSPAVCVDVDTRPPSCSFILPACGTTISSYSWPFRVRATVSADTTVTISHPDHGEYYSESVLFTSSFAEFPTPPSDLDPVEGSHSLVCSATDDHGNLFTSEPCVVTVDMSYTLNISTPTSGTYLGYANDVDPGDGFAARVCVTSPDLTPDSNLYFQVDGSDVGSTTFIGSPTCLDIPFTEGTYEITVWADVDDDSVSDASASSTGVVVDLTPPETISDLSVTILDRRESSLRLTWTSPSSGANSYQIRWSHAPITTEEEFDAASTRSWTGVPSGSSVPVSIDIRDLVIERDYYVAIRAVDLANNRGPFLASEAPTRPQFMSYFTEPGSSNAYLGWSLSPGGDINGDGFADMIVGSNLGTYIYFGPLPDFDLETAWSPDVILPTYNGTSGSMAAISSGIGDFNGDGYDDIAVGAPILDGLAGQIHIYYGGPATDWESEPTPDIVIQGNLSFSSLGTRVDAAGDFCDGDGLMDILITAGVWSDSNPGNSYIICGSDIPSGLTTTIDSDDLNILHIEGAYLRDSTSFFYGYHSTALGDINDDGMDDIAFSTPDDENGKVFIVRGLELSTIVSNPTIATDNSTYVQQIFEPSGAAFFGLNIAGIGDINNDGLTDLAVGSPNYDGIASNTGRVYIYLSDGEWLNPTPATIDADWEDAGGDRFGNVIASSCAGLGGAEDRSIADETSSVRISDLIAAGNGTNGGNIGVLFGSSEVLEASDSLTTSILADDPTTDRVSDGAGIVFQGNPEPLTYSLLSYIGDLTNDGYEDFALTDSTNSSNSGIVLIYY